MYSFCAGYFPTQKVTRVLNQVVVSSRYKWGTNKTIKNLFSFSLGFISRYKILIFFIMIPKIEPTGWVDSKSVINANYVFCNQGETGNMCIINTFE